MLDVRDIKNTNVFLIFSNDRESTTRKINIILDKAKASKVPMNGLEWSEQLHKQLKNSYILDCAIANYDLGKDPMYNIDNYNLLTQRVNTLILTALNDKENNIISKKVIRERKGLIEYLDRLEEIRKTPYIHYKQHMGNLLPELIIIESSTHIKTLLNTGFKKFNKACIEVVGIKQNKFNLIDALQLTLAVDKDRLLTNYKPRVLEQIKSVGFIEPHIAASGCINQALANLDSSHHPLALFIHSLQHYQQYPDTDKEIFSGELEDLFQTEGEKLFPLLTKSEIKHISDYILLYLRRFVIK